MYLKKMYKIIIKKIALTTNLSTLVYFVTKRKCCSWNCDSFYMIKHINRFSKMNRTFEQGQIRRARLIISMVCVTLKLHSQHLFTSLSPTMFLYAYVSINIWTTNNAVGMHDQTDSCHLASLVNQHLVWTAFWQGLEERFRWLPSGSQLRP